MYTKLNVPLLKEEGTECKETVVLTAIQIMKHQYHTEISIQKVIHK